MERRNYAKSQVTDNWNGIEVFCIDGKYGLYHPEDNVLADAVYDSIVWDKLSDFIMVSKEGEVGYLSSEDGSFIAFDDDDPQAPYLLATPYLDYLHEEWPDWMLSLKDE